MTSRYDRGCLGPHRIHALPDPCCAGLQRPSEAAADPILRDRVRIKGHDEVFFVVYVDLRRRTVDLVCGERVGFLSSVPFSIIRPAAERERTLWDFPQIEQLPEEPPLAG